MSSMMLQCPICLTDFIESKTEASSLNLMPCCENIFCKACLEEYVASAVRCPTCPMCRRTPLPPRLPLTGAVLMLYEAMIFDGAKTGNDNGKAKMVNDDHDGHHGWKPSVLDLYRGAYCHVWYSHTWFLALVAFLVGVTQAWQKFYSSPITSLLHRLAGFHGDAHNNHHEHDSPPPAEFTNHDPSMSTWFGIPDTTSSLVSGLFAPAATITKMYDAFRLPDVNIHAWLLQIFRCTGMGLICPVVYLVLALGVMWLLRRIPVLRYLIYPLYGVLVLVGLFQFFHDWKVLLFAVCYARALETCIFHHSRQIRAKLVYRPTGRIPTTTETEKCRVEMAALFVGIFAAGWCIHNLFYDFYAEP
jgi:Ring finger domain